MYVLFCVLAFTCCYVVSLRSEQHFNSSIAGSLLLAPFCVFPQMHLYTHLYTKLAHSPTSNHHAAPLRIVRRFPHRRLHLLPQRLLQLRLGSEDGEVRVFPVVDALQAQHPLSMLCVKCTSEMVRSIGRRGGGRRIHTSTKHRSINAESSGRHASVRTMQK